MSEFILDLSNYRDNVGARVDEGRYRVVVEDAEMDKSKAGNQMVNLWFRIQGGAFDGATITDRLTNTEKALFRFVGFMQAIGLPTPKKRLKLNLNQYIGKVLDIDVEDGDPYMGRVKSEVRGYIQVSKKEKAPEDAGDPWTDGDDAESVDTPDEPVKASAAPAENAEGDPPAEIDLDTLDL